MTEFEEDQATAGALVIPSLIDKATNSTASDVDSRHLSAIKSAARSSDLEIRSAVDSLLSNLRRPHSHVRYLSLLIADELFMRSSLFRSLIVHNFDHFLALTVGFRGDLPLPPPSSSASLLRSKSIEFLEKWNEKFGPRYRQIRLGFDYLKNTLRLQFPNRQQQRQERAARSNQILVDKFESLKESFLPTKEEIQATVDEVRRCLEIVRVEEVRTEFEFDGETEEEEFESLELRQIRLDSIKEGEKVRENSENQAVFDALRELYKLLVSKHLVTVQEWISVLIRVDLADNKFRDVALKESIDLRNLIQSVKKSCDELGCDLDGKQNPREEAEDEDLWEEGKIEVCSEDYVNIQSVSKGKSGVEKVEIRGNKGKGKIEGDDSSSRSRLLAEAPVLAWSPSLVDWSMNRDALANQRGLELDSHWGRVDPDAVIPAGKIAELKLHCTVYKEESTEIQPCLAPLRNGGLCQRRDLRECPFHGPIVPRDAEGNPIEQKKASRENGRGEDSFDTEKELAEHLAKRAVKNVREREKSDVTWVKRAKLAKVREHNEAVLREAAIASTSYSEAFGGDAEGLVRTGSGSKVKKPTLASMLKKKVTTKDRLERRLLSTRARDASSKQVMQGEDSKYREAFPNQW